MTTISLPNDLVFESVLDVISQGQSTTLLLVGNSMYPFLKDQKDKVTLSPIPHEYSLHKGDVVLFHTSTGYILHRIVRIDGDLFTMQGDNCLSCEQVSRVDIYAILTEITHVDGSVLSWNSAVWNRKSKMALFRKSIRNLILRCFNRRQRRWQTPLYFFLLAVLMWAPLNGFDVPLNNFVLGIRMDHLLHASIYLFCAFFLMDFKRLKSLGIWLLAITIGMLTESVQYLLPYRGFDINDMVANFFGATLGWLIVLRHLSQSHKR